MFAGISFTPKEVGEHEVSVRKSGVHVANSPFKIMVGQSEIGEASRVKAFGKGLLEAHTFENAEFYVDTRSAGKTLRQYHFYDNKNTKTTHTFSTSLYFSSSFRLWRSGIVYRGSEQSGYQL